MKLIALLLACVSMGTAEVPLPCDTSEHLHYILTNSNCTCINPTKPYITCSHASADMLSKLTKVNTLSFDNSEIPYLDKTILRSVTGLERLHLTNNKIKTVGKDAFSGKHSIKWLDLDNNQLSEIPDVFKINNPSMLKDLERLSLANNFITEIKENAFSGIRRLKYLDLKANNINVIYPSAWSGLASGDHFKLIFSPDGMAVTKIPTQDLEKLTSLVLIGGHPQKLTRIIAWLRFFSRIERLSMIRMGLEDNHLAWAVQPSYWKHQLRVLSLKDNLLETVPWHMLRLPALTKLDLSYNFFTVLTTSHLELMQLETLNLSHNNFRSVQSKIFLKMPKLIRLDLTYNKIQFLSWSIANIDRIFKVHMVMLISFNPWRCTCGNTWLPTLIRRQLDNKNGHLIRDEVNIHITCGHRGQKHGKLVRDVLDRFHNC